MLKTRPGARRWRGSGGAIPAAMVVSLANHSHRNAYLQRLPGSVASQDGQAKMFGKSNTGAVAKGKTDAARERAQQAGAVCQLRVEVRRFELQEPKLCTNHSFGNIGLRELSDRLRQIYRADGRALGDRLGYLLASWLLPNEREKR